MLTPTANCFASFINSYFLRCFTLMKYSLKILLHSSLVQILPFGLATPKQMFFRETLLLLAPYLHPPKRVPG